MSKASEYGAKLDVSAKEFRKQAKEVYKNSPGMSSEDVFKITVGTL